MIRFYCDPYGDFINPLHITTVRHRKAKGFDGDGDILTVYLADGRAIDYRGEKYAQACEWLNQFCGWT